MNVLSINQDIDWSGEYLSPNILIVGYGREQLYQVSCCYCGSLSFPDGSPGSYTIQDVICQDCLDRGMNKIPENNKNHSPIVGNIIGIKQKTEIRKKRIPINHQKIFERDKYTCQYCRYSPYTHNRFVKLHVDHVKPFSAGGADKEDNLVTACAECNLFASDKWFNSFEEKRNYIMERLP